MLTQASRSQSLPGFSAELTSMAIRSATLIRLSFSLTRGRESTPTPSAHRTLPAATPLLGALSRLSYYEKFVPDKRVFRSPFLSSSSLTASCPPGEMSRRAGKPVSSEGALPIELHGSKLHTGSSILRNVSIILPPSQQTAMSPLGGSNSGLRRLLMAAYYHCTKGKRKKKVR